MTWTLRPALVSVCYLLSNQSYEKYADEIKNRLNKLKEHIPLNNQDAYTTNIKNTFYENIAKNTFINGIKEPYHSYLLHFDLDDIEACIIKCRKYDNHEQQRAFPNFARPRENKPKPNVFNTVNAKSTNPFATNSNPKIIHPSNNLPSTSRNVNPFYLPTPHLHKHNLDWFSQIIVLAILIKIIIICQGNKITNQQQCQLVQEILTNKALIQQIDRIIHQQKITLSQKRISLEVQDQPTLSLRSCIINKNKEKKKQSIIKMTHLYQTMKNLIKVNFLTLVH